MGKRPAGTHILGNTVKYICCSDARLVGGCIQAMAAENAFATNVTKPVPLAEKRFFASVRSKLDYKSKG
jgi:hypothetical protein